MKPIRFLCMSIVLAGLGQLCLKTGISSFPAFSWTRATDLLRMLCLVSQGDTLSEVYSESVEGSKGL